MAAVENTLAFTLDDQPYSLTPTGEALPLSPFEAVVSEIRVWEGLAGGNQQVGVCLPAANQIKLGTVPSGQSSEWSQFLTRELGPILGPSVGALVYPLSFDVGPDGRIYVLDAGNSRILVFDAQRRYLTQWGRSGIAEGEFDFGDGKKLSGGTLDFAGSIAVDDEGYIYVADVFNQRIQKFAP